MNAKASSFSETNPKAKHKQCGNCRKIRFGLNKKETEFLNEKLQWTFNLETVRNWLKLGIIKGPHGEVNTEKMRVVKIILEHKRFCAAAAADVFYIDTPCFLWQPEPTCTLSPQEINCIRQRVFRELQKNPSLYVPYRARNISSQRFSPKMLCEALGLAWPQYRGCVSQACTDYKRLLRNKGYLARKARLE